MSWIGWYCVCSLVFLAFALREMYYDREHVFGSLLAEINTLAADQKASCIVLIVIVTLVFTALWPAFIAVALIAPQRRR